MIKGSMKKIAALSIVLAVALSTTAFAKSSSVRGQKTSKTEFSAPRNNKVGFKDNGFKKAFEQIGLTENEIKEARETGKNLFDLAKAKGYTADQVRALLVKNSTEAINKAVTDGKLSKEAAAEAVKKITERIAAWDGSLAFGKGLQKGDFSKGKASKGGHKRGGGFLNAEVLTQLGITKEDITKASEAGKTIFDLSKEKKGYTPEQVRSVILKAKTDEVNKLVTDGKMSKEKAEEITSKLKEKINAWDGTLKKAGKGRHEHKNLKVKEQKAKI